MSFIILVPYRSRQGTLVYDGFCAGYDCQCLTTPHTESKTRVLYLLIKYLKLYYQDDNQSLSAFQYSEDFPRVLRNYRIDHGSLK